MEHREDYVVGFKVTGTEVLNKAVDTVIQRYAKLNSSLVEFTATMRKTGLSLDNTIASLNRVDAAGNKITSTFKVTSNGMEHMATRIKMVDQSAREAAQALERLEKDRASRQYTTRYLRNLRRQTIEEQKFREGYVRDLEKEFAKRDELERKRQEQQDRLHEQQRKRDAQSARYAEQSIRDLSRRLDQKRRAEENYINWWDRELSKRDLERRGFTADSLVGPLSNVRVGVGGTAQQNLAHNNAYRDSLEKLRKVSMESTLSLEEQRKMMSRIARGEIPQVTAANRQLVMQMQETVGIARQSSTQFGNLDGSLKTHLNTWRQFAGVFLGFAFYQGIYNIFYGLKNAVGAAAELSIKLAEVQTIADSPLTSNKVSLQGMVATLSRQGNYALPDVTEAVYETLSNQIGDGAVAVQFLADAMDFGKASVSSLEDSVNLLSAAINAFGISAFEGERLGSVFFKMIDLGRVRGSEVADTMGRVNMMADQLGLTVEDVAAAISSLTIQGVKWNEGMTFLRNVMLKLARPTDAMKALFTDWGVASGQAAIAGFNFGGVMERIGAAAQGSTTELGELFSTIRGLQGGINLTGKRFQEFLEIFKSDDLLNEYLEAVELRRLDAGERFQNEMNRIKVFFVNDFGTSIVNTFVRLTGSAGNFADAVIGATKYVTSLGVILLGLESGIWVIRKLTAAVKGFTAAMAAYHAVDTIGSIASGVGGGARGIGGAPRGGRTLLSSGRMVEGASGRLLGGASGRLLGGAGSGLLGGAGGIASALSNVHPLLKAAAIGAGIVGVAVGAFKLQSELFKESYEQQIESMILSISEKYKTEFQKYTRDLVKSFNAENKVLDAFVGANIRELASRRRALTGDVDPVTGLDKIGQATRQLDEDFKAKIRGLEKSIELAEQELGLQREYVDRLREGVHIRIRGFEYHERGLNDIKEEIRATEQLIGIQREAVNESRRHYDDILNRAITSKFDRSQRQFAPAQQFQRAIQFADQLARRGSEFAQIGNTEAMRNAYETALRYLEKADEISGGVINIESLFDNLTNLQLQGEVRIQQIQGHRMQEQEQKLIRLRDIELEINTQIFYREQRMAYLAGYMEQQRAIVNDLKTAHTEINRVISDELNGHNDIQRIRRDLVDLIGEESEAWTIMNSSMLVDLEKILQKKKEILEIDRQQAQLVQFREGMQQTLSEQQTAEGTRSAAMLQAQSQLEAIVSNERALRATEKAPILFSSVPRALSEAELEMLNRRAEGIKIIGLYTRSIKDLGEAFRGAADDAERLRIAEQIQEVFVKYGKQAQDLYGPGSALERAISEQGYKFFENVLDTTNVNSLASSIAALTALQPEMEKWQSIRQSLIEAGITVERMNQFKADVPIETAKVATGAEQAAPLIKAMGDAAWDAAGKFQALAVGMSTVTNVMPFSPSGLPIVTPQARALGGRIMGRGTDTIPALLSPNEFVVNSKSTSKYLPLLQAINSDTISGFARGGFVRRPHSTAPSFAGVSALGGTSISTVNNNNINLVSTGNTRIDAKTTIASINREQNRGGYRLHQTRRRILG